MTDYRDALPQLEGELFLTDAGIETTLIFHDGLDLPHFAAFHLLTDDSGTETLRRYFRRHADIARAAGVGFILESATWRASRDWGEKLGYSAAALAAANRRAVELLHELRAELETAESPMVISGCVGPRGDGYDPGAAMAPTEAEAYHTPQIRALADAGADMVTAITMTNAAEATGVARAARAVGVPSVISFTVETDGALPTGQSLAAAIREVDAATEAAPVYYMINCAHPSHFREVLGGLVGPVRERLRGVRANASRRSHEELDNSPDLDAGDPAELAEGYRELRRLLPRLNVLGGCCGTDHRHIEAIYRACAA